MTASTPDPLQTGRRADPLTGLALLRQYRVAWLRADLIGGVTVGAMLVPQSMAYAELAGVPAATGLYAAVLAPVAYALAGTSRHLGTGPEPGTAILAAAGVAAVSGSGDPARYLALMAALAILVGVVAAGARLLRLGFVANLLSRPVLVGYITGVGVVLLISQLGPVTGVAVAASDAIPRLLEFTAEAASASAATLAVAAATLALLLAVRRYAPTLPSPVLAVGAVTAVAVLLDLEASGVAAIGAVPAGLPQIALPGVAPTDVAALVPAALGIALVGYADNVLTGRSIGARSGYRIDATQELTALAAANLAAGLTQGMPVSSSASRTAVAASLRSVTTLVSIVASAIVAATLLFAGPLLALVPRAALGAVIVAAAIAILDIAGFAVLWRLSKAEFALAVATAAGVVVLGVLSGVFLAVGLSAVIALGRMARPQDAVLGAGVDLDGWVDVDAYPDARTLPGLLVYRFDAPLFFMNIERFRHRVDLLLETNPGAEEWVILDFEGIGEVDATATEALQDLVADLQAGGVRTVAITRGNAQALERLRSAGLLAPDGPLRSFATINAAVAAFRNRAAG